jgi:hypothetical protein
VPQRLLDVGDGNTTNNRPGRSPDYIKRVTAHEMFHTFALVDEDFGIRCRQGAGNNALNLADGGRVSDAGLGIIRNAVSPGTSTHAPANRCN